MSERQIQPWPLGLKSTSQQIQEGAESDSVMNRDSGIYTKCPRCGSDDVEHQLCGGIDNVARCHECRWVGRESDLVA